MHMNPEFMMRGFRKYELQFRIGPPKSPRLSPCNASDGDCRNRETWPWPQRGARTPWNKP